MVKPHSQILPGIAGMIPDGPSSNGGFKKVAAVEEVAVMAVQADRPVALIGLCEDRQSASMMRKAPAFREFPK